MSQPSYARRRRNAQPWPRAAERRLMATLGQRVRSLQRLTLAQLLPRMDGRRLDGLLDPAAVAQLVALAEASLADPGPGVIASIRLIDRRATRATERAGLSVPRIGGRVRAAFSGPELAQLVSERVDLIKTIDARYFARLEQLLREAAETGETARRSLAGRIRSLTGASLSDARRIARDQVGSINSEITRKRYADAGISRYRWATVRDEAVREAHRELHGQVFDLAGPGAVGAGVFGQDIHPGDDIQCRCRRVPMFDDES